MALRHGQTDLLLVLEFRRAAATYIASAFLLDHSAILRNPNVSIIEAYYIKTTERDAVAAMEKCAAEMAVHEL